MQTDTNQYDIEQLSNIHPRLCTLHKWSNFDGYGIHLSYNEHWRSLHIEEIEVNSPAQSSGLLREDIILAVNGHSIENEDFFVILSFIQHELEQDQIRFLVLDPPSVELARHYQLNIDENNENCIRTEHSSDDKQSEPRLCSITLRSDVDSIGISLQSDTDFSHIITEVRSNSPADRVGIEKDDCIISLNNTLLLQIPFEDVLYYLAKSRHESKLDFLVAKKSYLRKLSQNHLNINDQEFSSSNIIEKKRSSTLPDAQTLEKLEQNQQQRKIIKDEQYDRLSLQIYSNLNIAKRKKRHGKIMEGLGPATALRFSWSVTSEKTIDYSSIRSDLYGRRPGIDEIKERRSTMKDAVKSLQVGMTNPSPKPSTRRFPFHFPSVSFSNDGQRTTESPLPKHNKIIQNILNVTPVQSSPIPRIRKQDNRQVSQSNLRLATMPISELPNHGYELHTIKLMKPTETMPVGFKLTKQTDPFQYIMTAIGEQSKADIAGLKVDDWLIKIEDNDIRLTELDDILQNISQLFNTNGFINLLIARKKSTKNLDEPPISDKTNILSSVGLSNPHPSIQSIDPNLDKIRHMTLKETSGLYFNSFIPDNNNQIQVHFITNIQPISIAYRAGLRNHDRILTINDVDVTNTSPEDLRLMISKTKPIQLTVIKDSKYLQLIENYKHHEIQKTASPIIYETIDHRQSKQSNKIIFIDEDGPVYLKHCIIKKDSFYDALGFLLQYEDGVHTINNVDVNYPGYNNGLRDNDIILFVNKKNIQQMTHDDVTIFLRSLVISNEIVDLIILKKKYLQRFINYQRNNVIDWNNILSKIYEDSIDNEEHSYVNQPSSPSLLSGARICVLETSPNRSLGFSIECVYPPPFRISKIEKDSPAEKAGIQLNDVLLSINGKSVLEKSYEDTIQIIKESYHQKIVQLVVNQSSTKKKQRSEGGSHSSLSYSSDDDGSTHASTIANEPSHRGTNAVQQYQKQRTKELSYTLRLCHLNATTIDGTPASSFGFEITGDPEYEYPIISRVEPKLAGDRSGLQKGDILLKVNDRKTKGAAFDKIKKAIEKAKRDSRLVLLVVDKDTFNYCIKTHKKFKEPYIKVKHIFPRSRSSTSYHSLPMIAAQGYSTSQESLERSTNGTPPLHIQRLPTQSENEENALKSSNLKTTVDFDLSSPTHVSFPHDKSSKLTDPKRKLSHRKYTSSPLQNEKSMDDSITDFVLNTINNFRQNNGSEKPTNRS